MALQSMTGYGRGVAVEAEPLTSVDWRAEVELKSVNARFLKLHLRTSLTGSGFDKALEHALRDRISRGTVSATIRLVCEGSTAVRLDAAVVRAYQLQFRRLGLDESSLPTMPGVVLSAAEPQTNNDFQQQLVKRAIQAAVSDLERMRRHEGQALCVVLLRLVDHVELVVKKIAHRAPEVVPAYAARLRERIEKLLSTTIPVESADLAREVAVLADRVDVTEELDRLAAHIDHLRTLLTEEVPVGRRIEFLTQELHREANTLGSKNIDADIAQWVIDLKVEIEKIKEQVANLE